MAASPRRVGAETSKTRDALLDCVERLMGEEGLRERKTALSRPRPV